jgi:uncharacterized protein
VGASLYVERERVECNPAMQNPNNEPMMVNPSLADEIDHPTAPGERVYRFVEYVSLFWVMPVLALVALRRPELWEDFPRRAALPLLLWSAFVACFIMLWRDPTFDRRQFWRWRGLIDGSAGERGMRGVVGRWIAATGGLVGIVYLLKPDVLFSFVQRWPERWALIMLFYPILSVIPQGVIYRNFMFHRYRAVFRGDNRMIWASVLAFSWSHVIFQSWIALVLTFIGGWFFTTTYAKSRSGAASWAEHALHGCMVFTIGLGGELYLR